MEELYMKKGSNAYLSVNYLVQYGMNRRTLENYITFFNKGKSSCFETIKDSVTKMKWISYQSIPKKTLLKLNIPITEVELVRIMEKIGERDLQKKHREIWLILSNAWSNPLSWKQYVPFYTMYYLDRGKRILFAKTHAAFNEVILLKKQKRYRLKEIHKIYLKLEKAVFWNEDYNYYSKKIRLAEENGIQDTLLHDFKRFGRNNYALTPLVKKRITFYYVSCKNYSRRQIAEMVNEELRLRGLRQISYSTVTLFLRNNEIKNRLDMLRKGEEYTQNHLLPHFTRMEPENIADVYQVDSTRLNVPYKNDDGKTSYLHLCVAMDVFTRKIIGHSFSETENIVLIMQCLRMALEEFKYVPRQIVVDSHPSYSSSEFTSFNQKMDDYGVHVRRTRPYNPRDKGHVERWFRTFSSYYLNRIMGNLGFGIKSKIEDGRACQSLERFYMKPANLRTKKQLVELIVKLIDLYNKDTMKKRGEKRLPKPHNGKFKAWQIANIFYKAKRIKVRQGMVRLSINGRKSYTIENIPLSEKLNDTYIMVRYDENDPSRIYLFDLKRNEYQGFLDLDVPLSIVLTPSELGRVKRVNGNHRKRIQSNFDKVVQDIDEGQIQLEALPILQEQNPQQSLAKIMNQAEDQMLISEMIEMRKPKETKEEIPLTKGKKHITENYYRKVRNKKLRIIN